MQLKICTTQRDPTPVCSESLGIATASENTISVVSSASRLAGDSNESDPTNVLLQQQAEQAREDFRSLGDIVTSLKNELGIILSPDGICYPSPHADCRSSAFTERYSHGRTEISEECFHHSLCIHSQSSRPSPSFRVVEATE